MLLVILLAAADTSAPPLVPMEPAPATSEQERLKLGEVGLPLADEPPPPPSRAKRLLGTGTGALVGDAFAVAVWLVQMALLGGACGLSCLGSPAAIAVTGAGSLLSLGPLGPLLGNRAVGGELPYWKALLGTLAGGALAASTIGAFEVVGFFRGPSNAPSVAAAMSVGMVEVLMGQVLISELGVADP